jgi:hypothetical protein
VLEQKPAGGAAQPPLFTRHSLTSVQVTPFPVKPLLQAHVRDPMVLVHVALRLQPPLLVRHSFTSTQLVPERVKPVVQVKPQVPAEQVVVEFEVDGHTEHELPHDEGDASDTHCCPHGCWPDGHSHTPAMHIAPVGQSAMSRHPAMQRREMGSQ